MGKKLSKVMLSPDEIVVLFEFVSRCNESGILARHCEHDSELQCIVKLEHALEESLEEPLSENYEDILQAARVRVVGEKPRVLEPID